MVRPDLGPQVQSRDLEFRPGTLEALGCSDPLGSTVGGGGGAVRVTDDVRLSAVLRTVHLLEPTVHPVHRHLLLLLAELLGLHPPFSPPLPTLLGHLVRVFVGRVPVVLLRVLRLLLQVLRVHKHQPFEEFLHYVLDPSHTSDHPPSSPGTGVPRDPRWVPLGQGRQLVPVFFSGVPSSLWDHGSSTSFGVGPRLPERDPVGARGDHFPPGTLRDTSGTSV